MLRKKDAFNKYTQISSNNGKPGFSKPLQFIVVEGNNSNLIRNVMQTRLASFVTNEEQTTNFTNWEECQNTNMFNFKWKPTSNSTPYDRLSKHGFK